MLITQIRREQRLIFVYSVGAVRLMCKELRKMGTRNRAFEVEGDEDDTRNEVHEIPTISKQSHTDGPQLSKFVSDFLGDLERYFT